ncbi:DUF6271 family protein [Actinocrispum sp. NPDC049592]|uniref:DUF6271 family protein n=1 Tax=Actinocrispum sp. NPDC049592 TaxID=3154835 RepID=UPI00343B3BD7
MKICLCLPTNRQSVAAIQDLIAEARYAQDTFDVDVEVLILDSASEPGHAEAVRQAPDALSIRHLDEPAQERFLREVIQRANVAKPDLILDLMLPDKLSYGACTNRAFLIAAALGCDSVHRRDSDSGYQVHNGQKVYPVHHELMSLGRKAADARTTASDLGPEHAGKPVVLVGSSFIGELSVDIGEILDQDPDVYQEVVGLWAPGDWDDEQRRDLVGESFRGAGTEPFHGDHSLLTIVDPMRVDMCNISFHQVHEDVPLPPMTDTIGSDYFLLHVVRNAGLPGVLHNRNIVNFHTPERKTGTGFTAYQLRYTKFLLSMLYLHFIYAKMAETPLLDKDNRVKADVIAELARESAWLGTDENVRRLDRLEAAYRRLGGKYAEFADLLMPQRQRLLAEARQDIEDFAVLIDAWAPLVQASRTVGT